MQTGRWGARLVAAAGALALAVTLGPPAPVSARPPAPSARPPAPSAGPVAARQQPAVPEIDWRRCPVPLPAAQCGTAAVPLD